MEKDGSPEFGSASTVIRVADALSIVLLIVIPFTQVSASDNASLPGTVSAPADPGSGVVAENASLETLWEGQAFTEGVAAGPDGWVYFSAFSVPYDAAPARIMKFDPLTGQTFVHIADSKMSNGLTFDKTGTLLACSASPYGGMGALIKFMPDGTPGMLAERYRGKRFNSPNDLVIDRQGRIYFSDPAYLAIEVESMELDSMDVYRLDPDGSLHRVVTDISKPNGVMLSPDEKTLYVSEFEVSLSSKDPAQPPTIGRMTLNAFPVMKDGSVGNKRVLVDFGNRVGIDGMTVDRQGRIYAAVRDVQRHGIYVFDPATGRELDYINTPHPPTNCAFGINAESNSLYITAGNALYRIRLKAAGINRHLQQQ